MGIKYSAADSALLIEAMTNNVELANQISDRLASGCDHLINSLDSGELQGAAYTAGKGLFTDIIIPSIKKLQAAIDDIQAELASYKSADSIVAEYGSLDLEQLEQLKRLKERQLELVQEQIKENKDFWKQAEDFLTGRLPVTVAQNDALYEVRDQLEIGIREIEEKIEKLEWFVSQVSHYFTDSLEVLRLAIQGAVQLSQVPVDSEGHYYTDGLDMIWAESMRKEEIQTYQLDKENKKRYRQELSKKIEDIKKSSESEHTKTDQIIKAYEDYLYLSNKEAFDDYWKKRKAYDDKWEPEHDKYAKKIEEELSKRLQESGMDIKDITVQMGEDILDVTGRDGWDYLQFKDLVDTGEPMDLKTRAYSEELPFSVWSRDWTGSMKEDYLGNYLYGYVGQGMLAVDGDILKYAAGGAQLWSNASNNNPFDSFNKFKESIINGEYGDNLGDSQMIQDGIDRYNQNNGPVRKFLPDSDIKEKDMDKQV